DPFLFKHRGCYYCYSTHRDGVQASTSQDLVRWDYQGFVLQTAGQANFWAPAVHYEDGVFYLYYSSAPAGSLDPHDERLRVAVSDSPLGPFTPARVLFDRFTIDPQLVRSDDGQRYLFYSANDPCDGALEGTSILVQPMSDPLAPAGKARHVVIPTLEQEIFERNRFGDGRDWHTIEGATYFTSGRMAYLTYSGNAYTHEDYFVGYATAPLIGAIDELHFTKHPDEYTFSPLIRRSAYVEGTGHNSVIAGPDLFETWIAYHGRDAGEPLVEGTEQRTLRIDRLRIGAGELATNAPTSTPQIAPAKADYSDAPGQKGLGWRALSGSFSQSEDGLALPPGSLLAAGPLAVGYRAEFSAKGELGYAFCPARFTDGSYIEVSVSPDGVRASHVTSVGRDLLITAGAPKADLSKWQLIEIERAGKNVSIRLAGLPLAAFRAPIEPARLALNAENGIAQFSGFALTKTKNLSTDRKEPQ
ncbi:MAG: glycoside hydrolase family 43 protein, partial [Propionibacteriaceae bacterium]|nr:glycoside hydrolase family 43 protein [Propionibacteriaceae bacterium]